MVALPLGGLESPCVLVPKATDLGIQSPCRFHPHQLTLSFQNQLVVFACPCVVEFALLK